MGVRGIAMRPAEGSASVSNRAREGESRQRTGTRSLEDAERLEQAEERLDARGLRGELDDHAVLAHVDDLRAELLREDRD